MLKELELRRSEIAELSRTKEKLSSRQEEMEQTLAYLQEQVDAALGAEEMVENLTTKNLTLEERVKELEEAVTDLEAIGDMNEQLQEGSRELELELREELDLAHSSHREAIRELEASQETLADRDQTIKKFRELVQQLQDRIQELQEQQQRDTNRPLSALPEMIDFKKMFAESKAHTKAIDLELRRIDVQQSNQHVHFLTAYMPESFMARGGDHDAMMLLLLVPRLLRKADIVVEQVRDKFPPVTNVDRAEVLRSHAIEQFAFASRLGFWIYRLQSTLEQLMRALSSCSPDTLLRVGVLYSDLAMQERAVDALVELLRHDQLDENISLEALEKCVGFCQVVMTTHLPPSGEPSLALPQQLVASCRALSAACDHLHTVSSSILVLMQSASKPEKAGVALQDVQCATDMLRQQLKQCRRRLTGPLPMEHAEKLVAAQESAAKLIHAMHDCLRACMQQSGMLPSKVLKLLQTAVTEHVTSESDVEMGQDLRNLLAVVESCVKNLSQAVHDGDYELESKLEEKVVSPIMLRAQCVKKELEETKLLRQKLEARETDIKELKKVLKLKQEELGEMVIRKDLAESKLGNVHKDYAVNMEKLQRKLDDCQMMLRRKEKEFEETMDHLQADIDSLESERGELKEKVKNISKKALIEASSSGPGSVSGGVGPSLPIAVRDSPMLVQQISDLRLALRHSQNETMRSRIQAASKQLASLPPLKVCTPSLGGDRADVDNTTAQLIKQATTLHKDLLRTLCNPMVVDISGRKAGEVPLLNKTDPNQQLAQRNVELHKLHARVDALQAAALEHMTSNKPGTRAVSSFAAFPTVAFAKALQEEKAECVGRVSLVSKSATGSTPTVPLVLDLASLRRLHASIAL
ncbi:hypothetical protein B566_EDAN006171 [Ephemera danica]|nr:hypothetical protein B566_EDAN006171 [Ephemera danica]